MKLRHAIETYFLQGCLLLATVLLFIQVGNQLVLGDDPICFQPYADTIQCIATPDDDVNRCDDLDPQGNSDDIIKCNESFVYTFKKFPNGSLESASGSVTTEPAPCWNRRACHAIGDSLAYLSCEPNGGFGKWEDEPKIVDDPTNPCPPVE